MGTRGRLPGSSELLQAREHAINRARERRVNVAKRVANRLDLLQRIEKAVAQPLAESSFELPPNFVCCITKAVGKLLAKALDQAVADSKILIERQPIREQRVQIFQLLLDGLSRAVAR